MQNDSSDVLKPPYSQSYAKSARFSFQKLQEKQSDDSGSESPPITGIMIGSMTMPDFMSTSLKAGKIGFGLFKAALFCRRFKKKQTSKQHATSSRRL